MKVVDPRVRDWGFPSWGQAGAGAGLDLYACLDEPLTLAAGAPATLVSSGLAIHIRDPDWVGLVVPDHEATARGLSLGNTVGVIDADYVGVTYVSAWNRNPEPVGPHLVISPGERIARFLFVRMTRPTIRLVTEFSVDTVRGAGGFGSTGSGKTTVTATT